MHTRSRMTRRVAVVAAVAACLSVGAPAAGAIDRAPATPSRPSASETVSASASSFKALRRGDSGTRVRRVQYALKKRGFHVATNGKFGPLTHSAVRRFQRIRRIKVTGTVGAQTWKALGLPLAATKPSPTTTTRPPGVYRHPSAAVERWHAVALQVGWAERDWKRLSCVIQRESRGNPRAQNRSTAMGLLQILYRVHRVWVGPDATILLDPATNLKFGLKMFKGRGWKPWASVSRLCDA